MMFLLKCGSGEEEKLMACSENLTKSRLVQTVTCSCNKKHHRENTTHKQNISIAACLCLLMRHSEDIWHFTFSCLRTGNSEYIYQQANNACYPSLMKSKITGKIKLQCSFCN
jgi:hypothetical protein